MSSYNAMIGHASTVEVPDLIEEVTVYRGWIFHRDRLKSPMIRSRYGYGPNPILIWKKDKEAKCLHFYPSGQKHEAPKRECSCGIYGYYRFSRAFFQWFGLCSPSETYVMGAIKVWGRIIPYSAGIRAQHAEIAWISLMPTTLPSKRKRIKSWAETNQVRVVSIFRLPWLMRRHGKRLPADFIPESAPPVTFRFWKLWCAVIWGPVFIELLWDLTR